MGKGESGGEPLHVMGMAIALILAAIAGAGIGFAWHSFAPDDAESEESPAEAN